MRPATCFRTLGLLFGAVAAPALLFAPTSARAAIEIVTPQSVRDRYVVQREGRTMLEVDGMSWELVTDPRDPSISQLGDGSFHPMSPLTVREAIQGLDRAALSVEGRILILPYPRRSNLKSSCEEGVIFLSPGIREVAAEHIHSTTIHEVGHLVQRSRALEGSRAWEEYLDRRQLRDPRYASTAMHRDRPREIFAEDFRFLFGTPLATTSGTIENPDLPLPTTIPGLREWFEALLRGPRTESVEEDHRDARVYPNPFRRHGSSTIAFASSPVLGEAPAPAVIVDLSGRRVRTLPGAPYSDAGPVFTWDGRADDGSLVSAGTYFVHCADSDAVARVQFLR